MKKKQVVEIQPNTYTSWPGLDEYIVRQHLEESRKSGKQTTKKKEQAREKEMKDILAEQNKSLEHPVPGILQSRER